MKKTVIIIVALIFFAIISVLLVAQDVELIFSHKYHAEEVGASCSDCHKASESAKASDNLLPNMDGCYSCHDEDEECSKCHKDPDNAIVYPRITDFIAKFPHDKHAAKNITCEKCHEKVADSDNIMEKHLPKMAVCVECHKELTRDDYCYDCHAKKDKLKPATHDFVWKSNHGVTAIADEDACETCHTKSSCLDCHKSDNLDRQVHPLNFVNNHGLYAKGNKENCYTCHEELAFCVDCHRKRMVMPRNHSFANWSNATTGGAHARAAQLDLDFCLSCHSDAQSDPVCVICHK